jgi:hypothetical protein
MIDTKNPFGLYERLEARDRGLKTDGPALGMGARFQKFARGRVRSAADLTECRSTIA